MTQEVNIERLNGIARELRALILKVIANAGSGHPGGSLSAIDILTYLYFHHLRIEPKRPDWEDRDRFVLSKGHCAPALYVTLARRGYFSEDLLWLLREIESPLQGHPDMKRTPGVDMTTGSLGLGFSSATGMALGAKVQGKSYRVYVMLSDGELQAGVVWEAAMAAAHYQLDNLVAIVDNNRLQTDGFTAEIMAVEPIVPKWEAFGWHAQRIDGHDFRQIHAAFRRCLQAQGKPHVIVADTVKGKGVSVMENNPEWHSGALTAEQLETFLAELSVKERA